MVMRVLIASLWLATNGLAQDDAAPTEDAYYRIRTIEAPADVVLEVSGLLVLPDGRPMVATRRGQVFIIDDATGAPQAEPVFHLYAEGLQEPLGLLQVGKWIYVAQRGELSRMLDEDGDDRVDVIETVCDAWPISGNYHEYAFGPRLDREGNFWITLNKPFGDEPFGVADWRGWAIRVTPDGKMIPTACGLRSPAGVEISPWGDVFYTDNQGEWCGASKLSVLEPGDFHGHPHGLFSCLREDSPIPHPGEPPNGELMPAVAKKMPTFRLPAIWFPYDKMGKSPAGMVWDQTGGGFGAFTGQLFVGDQHHSSVLRCFLEEVNGHWQGACFPFREGFTSGVLRLAFAQDSSMFVGMSNRGWGSRGVGGMGLQRLAWTGKVPFEVLEMRARKRGFELVFTRPVDRETARRPESYRMESYTYKLHSTYGSDEFDKQALEITDVKVAPGNTAVTLTVSGLRPGYVHELHMDGLRDPDGHPLLHADAYYTLIQIPR